MQGRIGTLHVRYQVAPSSRFGPAIVPGISRTLQQELADAVETALDRAFGARDEVVVIREAAARLALAPSQWGVSGHLLDAFSRAASNAVVDLLAAPPPDTVARFEDQAEFVASFVADLCDGAAWDQWRYGAFAAYRDPDAAVTITQVLADNETCVARVLALLAQYGRLDRVLALLGGAGLRSAIRPGTASGQGRENDVGALAQAGFQVLEALGYEAGGEAERRRLVDRYLAGRPLDASWADRRSLSAWVFNFVRFAILRGWLGTRERAAAGERVADLLAGELDWLDREWLEAQLADLADGRPGSSAASVLPPPSRELLERLGALLRGGGLRLRRDEGVDAAVVRVTAALGSLLPPGSSVDRVTLEALERIVAAWGGSAQAGKEEARLAAGSDGEMLLEALSEPDQPHEEGLRSAAGGLYLFARAIMDTGMLGLAARHAVPREPLMGSIAKSLLGLEPPFDLAAALWVGDPEPDSAGLEREGDALEALRADLASTIAAQSGGSAELDGSGIVELLCRAWSRWLPGFADASTPFLVEQCLRRDSVIHVTHGTVEVCLEPAPLDVVLGMAGYLRPMGQVSWLGDRRVVFRIADRSG